MVLFGQHQLTVEMLYAWEVELERLGQQVVPGLAPFPALHNSLILFLSLGQRAVVNQRHRQECQPPHTSHLLLVGQKRVEWELVVDVW